jgi:hypothetical protein
VKISTDAPLTPDVIHGDSAEGRPAMRRRGDAILIAFNRAYHQGDVEVAAQLLIEYQAMNSEAPLLLKVDRRKRSDHGNSAIAQMWDRLRARFAS